MRHAGTHRSWLRKRQLGLTLVELLVGVAVGVMVVGGGVAITVSILTSNTDTVRASRLNQDLAAIMSIMVSDVRRAGYQGELLTKYVNNASLDTTATCIHYGYADGGTAQHYGFRLSADSNELDMRKNPASFTCIETVTADDWEALNDTNEIEITAFGVTDNSSCVDSDGAVVADGDGDGYCLDEADSVISLRQVDLTLTGRLTKDPNVSATIRETVRIRNNEKKS